MKKGIFFFAVLLSQYAMGQVAYNQPYSKAMALQLAKTFVIKDVLGEPTGVVKFKFDALVAATSGELTTLEYECEEKKQSGLILGFFEKRFNENGVNYKSYEFKNLSLSKADELFDKIETVMKDNYKYLSEGTDNNNIYFTFEDLTVLIQSGHGVANNRIRIYWKDFDAYLNANELERSHRRLSKETE